MQHRKRQEADFLGARLEPGIGDQGPLAGSEVLGATRVRQGSAADPCSQANNQESAQA